jgi:putative peptide zinc metalloprotease protein
MMSSPPRLRDDLTVSQQEAADGTVVIVKDPVSGDFFRFHEAEHFIARQFDGETPLEVIRRRTEERFGAALSSETLAAFCTTLERAGLLETETAKRRRGSKSKRIRGNLFRIRFKAFDPNELFGRLVRRVRFFFTPQFLSLSAAVILLAAFTLASSWGDVRHDVSRLLRLSALPPFLAVIFLVGAAHEFAHGLTCKRFGGDVHEVGFMLIYFQPAFFCNVSDAWLFPEKSRRLWVSFAGPYFELFLWGLATLTWRVTAPETWINYVALIVMAGSGVSTLFNFNPFIKLDGYYLLSDYLGIPNLRRRSFRYVGGLMQRAFGVGRATTELLSARERRIFLLYGLAASAGTFALLGYILVTAGGYLIEGRQPLAILFTGGYVVLKFQRRFKRWFGAADGGADDEDDDGDLDAAPAPDAATATATAQASTPEARPTPPKRRETKKRKRSWKRRHTWMALAAAAVPLTFVGHMELRVAGPFAVLPVHNADVRSEIDGIIDSITVTEGDRVRAGDVIARLSDRENRAQLEQTEAQIQQARAQLRLLQVGATQDSIQLARTEVQRAQDALKYALARLDRNKLLAANGVVTRIELENTQEQADAAKNDLAEAQRKLQVLLRGSRPEEIEATKAEIARLEAQQRFLTGQLERGEVRSPASGVVATPARQLAEMRGQVVQKGALIAKVFDMQKLTVNIAIPEKELAEVRVGQAVALKAQAYPGETFHGTVASIATSVQAAATSPGGEATIAEPTSATSSTPRTILVTTEIDNPSLLLKPGMTGQAKIACGPRRIVDLITRRFARTLKVEFWSWW